MLLLILFVFGLLLGSFINALVWRVYAQTKTTAKSRLEKLSITKGRSICPHCEHVLAPVDLIPVISWLSLRGKCRYCPKKISIQYPIVELLTAITFLVIYTFWPYSFDTIGWIMFVLMLLISTGLNALFVYDLRWMILPTRIVYPVVGLSLLFVLFRAVSLGQFHSVITSLIASLSISGLFFALFQYSKGAWIGGGDVRLALALGLLAGGIFEVLLLLFLASFTGSLIGLPLMVTHKNPKQIKLPFGPLLIAATYVVFLFSPSILGFYLDAFFL